MHKEAQTRTYIHAPNSRRYFWWTLAVSYACVTAVVLFYTLGYRFSFKTDIFVHTGSINVKSEPQDLHVLIDGKEPSSRHLNFINSSYHIAGLRYGEHTVEFSAPGYKTWTDKVTIRSGRATEFWNLILVQENYERSAYDVVNPKQFFFAPGNDLVAYPRQGAADNNVLLTITNITENRTTNFGQLTNAAYAPHKNENIEWSPSQDSLIVPVERMIATPIVVLPVTDVVASEKAAASAQALLQADLSDEAIDEPQLDVVTLPSPQKDYVIAVRDELGFSFTYLGSIINHIAVHSLPTDADVPEVLTEPTPEVPEIPVAAEDLDTIIVDETESIDDTVADTHPTITHVRWQPNQTNTLYAIVDGTLTQFDTADPTLYASQEIMKNVVAYDFADDGIYILNSAGILFRDESYDGSRPLILAPLIEDLDSNGYHRLIAYDKDRIMHINDTSGALTLYNREGDQLLTRKLADSIIDARFSNDGKKIVFYGPNDIYAFFTREWTAQPLREPNTIDKIFHFDTEITTVEWAPDYEHIFAASDGRIQLLELDHRGDHNLTEITTHAPVGGSVIMDQNNNKLYFTDKDGDNTTLNSIIFPRLKTFLGN